MKSTRVFHKSQLAQDDVFENIQDGVLILDTEWRYVYLNKFSETLVGKPRQELIGKIIWEVFPNSVGGLLYKKYHEAVRTKKTVEIQYFFPNTEQWFTIRVYPSPSGLTILYSDITEKKVQRERQTLLDNISELLTTSLDHKLTLKDISHRIVPIYADYCRIVLVDDHKQIIDVTAQHTDPNKVLLVQHLYDEYQGKSSITMGVDHILATGKPELMNDVEKEAPLTSMKNQPKMKKLVEKLELKSYMGVPLQARGKVLGVITFSSIQKSRHYTRDDLRFAQQIAERISIALDNAQLYTSLQKSETRFRALIEKSADAIALIDSKSTILYMSPSIQKFLGYTSEELLGKNAALFIHPDELSMLAEKSMPLFKAPGNSVTLIHRYKHKNGKYLWIESTLTNLLHDPSIGAIVSNFRDITERRLAEEALQESKNNLLFLAEASKLLSSSLDYNTTLQKVAKIVIPHIADWCGVDMLNTHGQIQQLAISHRDSKKVKWAKAYRKTHQPNMSETTGIPYVIKSKKSVLYPLITDEMLVQSAKNKKELALIRSLNMTSVMIVPIISKKTAIGAISFVTTDGKRQYSSSDLAMAEELANRAGLAIDNALLYLQAQKEIEERKKLEKQKDEFIGVASHELKTPVTSIKSFAQVLRLKFSKEGNTKAADLLGKLDAQVDKLTSLIADLLDVTKIEAGRMQFTQEYFSFDELVTELVEELQRTTEKHTLIKKGKTRKILYADRERVGQVLTNLISNAIKYSPHTKDIFIHSSVVKGQVRLCVQDFGVGIPKDKQSKVFERFFRVSGPGQETYPGLGLGLYVSSEIIKRLQGKIWVESSVGKGSTFCFTLPLKPKKEKEANTSTNTLVEEQIKHE